MLYGQIIKETTKTFTLRVASDRGDAKEHGIVGEVSLDRSECLVVNRRDLRGKRPRLLDELEVPATVLEELARRSPSSVE